jgi:hypothetical protein
LIFNGSESWLWENGFWKWAWYKASPFHLSKRMFNVTHDSIGYGQRGLVARVAPKAIVDWASVLVLPMGWQHHFPRFERRLSFRRNPLGAFLGLRVLIKEA